MLGGREAPRLGGQEAGKLASGEGNSYWLFVIGLNGMRSVFIGHP